MRIESMLNLTSLQLGTADCFSHFVTNSCFQQSYVITLNVSFEALVVNLCGSFTKLSEYFFFESGLRYDILCVQRTNASSLPTDENNCSRKHKYIWKHLHNI